MAIVRCPNKNSNEWKMLVKQVGEEKAIQSFLINNQFMPDVKPLLELKKILKVPETTYDHRSLAKRIATYNELHNTSHRFSIQKIGESMEYKIKFYPSYIPKNTEIILLDQLEAEYDVTNEKYDSEHALYSLYAKEIEEYKRGKQDNTDYLQALGPRKIEDTELVMLKQLESELRVIKDKLRNTTDPIAINNYNLQIEALNSKIEKAEKKIILSQNSIDSFEDVLSFATSQLNEVESLLMNPGISTDNLRTSQRILDLWKKAGDFSGPKDEHIILDEDEVNTDEIRNAFRMKRAKAEDLESKLDEIRKQHILDFVRKYTNKNLSADQIFQNLKDSGKINTLTRSIGKHDDKMLQAIYAAIETANINAQQEANEVWEKYDELTKRVLPILKGFSEKNPFRFFEQKTKDGLGTGKMAHRFSESFFSQMQKLRSKAFNTRDKNGNIKHSKSDIDNFYKWVNNNTITFDVRKIFPDSHYSHSVGLPDKFLFTFSQFTSADSDKHIAELKQNLGEKGYNHYIKIVENKLEKFKSLRESVWLDIDSQQLSDVEKDEKMNDWLKENSPYWGVEMIHKPDLRLKNDKKSYYKAKGIQKYSQQVPLRNVNGKKTDWYDSNFEKIEANDDLLEYYNYTIDTLYKMKSLLPSDKKSLMGITDIPKMMSTIADQFTEKGLQMGLKPFYDKMIQSASTRDLSTTDFSDINPFTGNKEKNITVSMIEDMNKKIKDGLNLKISQFKATYNTEPSKEIIQKFVDEVRHDLSQERSFDLTKLMKAYSLMALGYKHKSLIESQVKLVEEAFKNKKEIVTNKAGVSKKNSDQEIILKNGLENLSSQLDYTLDQQYYNTGAKKVEMVSKDKTYTTVEKQKLKELQEAIEKETDTTLKENLQRQADELGGHVTGSSVGDIVLRGFSNLKLGWNVGAATSNLGFGIISNLIHAADRRNFSESELKTAYLKVINSVGKNLSFNTLATKEAIKIRSLMDKFDITNSMADELGKQSSGSTLYKKMNRFAPMALTRSTEYLNNAPIMIASMLHHKATDPNGNEVPLWEMYDENGNKKDGYKSDINEANLILKVRRLIEITQGDYRNPLQIKSTIGGRAITQFRTWMFEGIAARFEKETEDEILSYGEDEKYIRKGRYRSYTPGQLTVAGAALGTTFLPVVGTLIGAGAGLAVGKFFGMRTEHNIVNDTLFTLKQLARKLTLGKAKTQFDERFSKTDAANMRKNMTELYVMMALAGMALLLSSLVVGDDDEEKKKIFAANFLLNQMGRMQSDISFYTNPLEAEKLTKTAVPMVALLDDVRKWFGDVINLFNDESDDDVFQSGVFKDESKAFIHGAKLIPGPAQVVNTIRQSSQIFD